MGNEIIFFSLLAIFVVVLLQRDSISKYLFEKTDIQISSKTLLYISIVGMILLMILGILFDNTKEKYSGISAGYNQMRPNAPGNEQNQKPHKMFDIDFDSIFPW